MKRFWEIDLARAIAVVLMVLFNWAFALKFLNISRIADGWLFWTLLPRIIASIFLLLVGISFYISYSRTRGADVNRKYFSRGAKIFAIGMAATAATWVLFPGDAILFGILHLIGISTILSVFFVKFERLNIIFGAAAVIAGLYLSGLHLNFNSLFWLVPQIFSTLDYFPFLPWLGVVLIGLAVGSVLYAGGKRQFRIKERNARVGFLGRHSLAIYIIHQPVLILILYVLGYKPF